MTAPPRTRTWIPVEDYDDRARWLDDADGGDRWRAWAACRGKDPTLFFPLVVRREVVPERVVNGEVVPSHVIEIATDEEPPYPPADVKAICDRCPVRGKCLDKFMDEDTGVFGGLTGYQRGLMTKKIKRKRCLSCASEDLVMNSSQRKEICLACGVSWDIL